MAQLSGGVGSSLATQSARKDFTIFSGKKLVKVEDSTHSVVDIVDPYTAGDLEIQKYPATFSGTRN